MERKCDGKASRNEARDQLETKKSTPGTKSDLRNVP